ncbi:fluoride efflux transporter FluC [Halobacillus sp. MO56]
MYKKLLAIGFGGALGTLCRYVINLQTLSTGLPIGTVIENLIGSMLLGLFTGWVLHRKPREWVSAGIGVGFCGGFTTMSTLAADTISLNSQVSFTASMIYLVVSIFGGTILAFGGLMLGAKWSGSTGK